MAGSDVLRFGVLGRLAVAQGGRDVVLSGGRRRALLARLIIDAGRPVSVERLAEDLWADDSTKASVPTLRTYVTKLRSVLGPGEVLVSRPGAYELAVDPATIDAVAFERDVAQ